MLTVTDNVFYYTCYKNIIKTNEILEKIETFDCDCSFIFYRKCTVFLKKELF